MCSWKALLLLACTASLLLSVASDDVQVDAAVETIADTQATEGTGDTATTESTDDAHATGDTTDTLDSSDASCGGPPRCKKDEVYTNCTNTGCGPFSCSEVGFPLKCDKCKPRCICKDSLVRADNGKCIERDQCPSCGGDPNAGPGCGSYCINCSNYNKKPVACPLGCIYNGCQCKDGFIYDRNIKKCVLPSQCTPTCGANEVYSTCTNGGCDARNCTQVGKPVPCINRTPESCIKGCVCASGYLRNSDGTCVPEDQCGTPRCKINEVYDTCPAPCPPRRCDVDDRTIRCVAPPEPGSPACQPGCRCADGYARNAVGKCVLRSQCEKPLKCKANEVYDACPGICPAQKCGVNPALIRCLPNPVYGDPRCQPACRCIDGYVRNADNVCIPKKQCPPTCGANEVYSTCTNGGCDARNCSQVGKPVPCINRTPESCIKGCVCASGYLRNSDGTCVSKDQCGTPQCKVNEVYDVCPPPCPPPRRCDDNGSVLPCAAPPIDAACRPSCRCADGYVRNAVGKCVLTSQCEKPLKCKANEVYDACPGICPAQKCGVNPAVILCLPNPEYGDPRCQPACRCIDGYVRNANNVCIPKEQCPPTCGANEVYDACINGGCDARNCTQLGKPVPCFKIASESCIEGCICASGYLRDSDGTCVPKDQCPTCTGQNEYFDNCIKGCSNQTCDSIGVRYFCPKQPAVCRSGCRCNPGFYRNTDAVCIEQSQCPQQCGANAYWETCISGCSNQTCNDIGKTYHCPIQPAVCRTGCRCNPGFWRNKDNICVAESQCPQQCGANAYWETCISGCSNQTCNDIGKTYKCPIQPAVCRTGCRCNPGYWRNNDNICVAESQCPQQCGENAYWETCISGCSNQTCDDIGKIYNCPLQPAVCRTGCRCNPGFWRNKDNKCVAESQCPTPPCPDGEVYNRCPTVKCEGDYCPKTRNSPQTCPVGIVCDPARCTCGFNQKRDLKTGKCIATRNCPPFACNGPNEEYQPCPVGCPGEDCTDYINDSKCPPGRIGIVLQCRPQCKCKTGYYRNAKGVCIIGCDCGPKKSAPTNTPVVITPRPQTGDDGNSGTSGTSGTGLADLQAGITKFTGQFLYDRMQANKGDNIIISASSVFTPLAQLALYAEGDSLTQLLSVLNVKSKDDIRSGFPALTASYEGQTNVSFATAQKVYSNIMYALSNDFKNDSIDIFHAEGQELDFSKNTEAAATINAWVESQTNDRIKDLVSPDMLSPLTRLVLVNAIYFKAPWLYEFDTKNTNDADFYLSDGTTKSTKLMYQQANFNYGEIDDLDCKVIELLYSGKNFSMFIALPNKNDGVTDLADKFRDPAVFNSAYGSMGSQKVELYLPPFEITTTTDLADILKQQNVTEIFDEENSGLSGILAKPEPISVTAAIQKGYIKTDESGSEAAAANAFIGSTTTSVGGPPPKRFIFRADHSFLYYIIIKTTSDIPIFSGTFRKPN